MKRITVALVASSLLVSTVTLFSGCGGATPTKDTMSTTAPKMGMEKMSDTKMDSGMGSTNGMSDGKMSDGKMSGDK